MTISTKSTLSSSTGAETYVPVGTTMLIDGAGLSSELRNQDRFFFVEGTDITVALNRNNNIVLERSESPEFFDAYKSYLVSDNIGAADSLPVYNYTVSRIKSDEEKLLRFLVIPTDEKLISVETSVNGTLVITEKRTVVASGYYSIQSIARFGVPGVTTFTFNSVPSNDNNRKVLIITWTQNETNLDRVFTRGIYDRRYGTWHIPVSNSNTHYVINTNTGQVSAVTTSLQMGSYDRWCYRSSPLGADNVIDGAKRYPERTVSNPYFFYWKDTKWVVLASAGNSINYLGHFPGTINDTIDVFQSPFIRRNLICFLVDKETQGSRLLAIGYGGTNEADILVYAKSEAAYLSPWVLISTFAGAGRPKNMIVDNAIYSAQGGYERLDCLPIVFSNTGTEITLSDSARGINYYPYGLVMLREQFIHIGFRFSFYGEPGPTSTITGPNGIYIRAQEDFTMAMMGNMVTGATNTKKEKPEGTVSEVIGGQGGLSYHGYHSIDKYYPIRTASRTYVMSDLPVLVINNGAPANSVQANEIERSLVHYWTLWSLALSNFVSAGWSGYSVAVWLTLGDMLENLTTAERNAITTSMYPSEYYQTLIDWAAGPDDDVAVVGVNFGTEKWVFVGGVDLRNAGRTTMTLPKDPHFYGQADDIYFTKI